MFKLYRLPLPQKGQVTGLIGKNGIGKSTALKILSGEIQANLGHYKNSPGWPEIIRQYRGSILQDYFLKLSEGNIRAVLKPQYVDVIPRVLTGTVRNLLEKVDETNQLQELLSRFELTSVADRAVTALSGGELQRFAIAVAFARNADVYLFDEPSSYLDVRQRMLVAQAIRSLKADGKSVIVSEHDLAILDYLSDQVCILYGEPAVYGVIAPPQSVRTGINIYLNGYLPAENVRFRKTAIQFHVKPPVVTWNVNDMVISWSGMTKSFTGFHLQVEQGQAHRGEVIGILGPNGSGKTTFIKLLAGIQSPDSSQKPIQREATVSYKPQYIATDYPNTVRSLLRASAPGRYGTSQYRTDIQEPFGLEKIQDRKVKQLSGGELQRVAIAACLSRKADIYLLDEPSAYLDVEERLTMTKVIRRVTEEKGSVAFVVEHDVGAQDFVADRIMVFSGVPGVNGYAHQPRSLREGMNSFLKNLNITFRRDPSTGRPRVNKEDSRLDQYQKSIGEYYYIPQKE
jgi:ATP-binding cassette subfamily E protein 1